MATHLRVRRQREPYNALILEDLKKFVTFKLSTRREGFTIGEPHFEEPAKEAFFEELNKCKVYLEYGTGGSTLAVSKLGLPFVAVEGDREFEGAVRAAIPVLKDDQHLLYADLGITSLWAVPLFRFPTKSRIQRWSSYWQSPWPHFSNETLPDLILIDGRFRVACSLETVKRLENREWTILVHDYDHLRPHYKIMERFANLDRHIETMAIFRPKAFAMADLEHELEVHSADWR